MFSLAGGSHAPCPCSLMVGQGVKDDARERGCVSAGNPQLASFPGRIKQALDETISRIEIKQGFSASTSCNLWISN